MRTEQLQEQEVFLFMNWKMECDEYDDYFTTEKIRVIKSYDGYRHRYELSANGIDSFWIGYSPEVLEGLKRILSGLNWNYEYQGERAVEETHWELRMDLPDLKFRSRGYNTFPPDYEQVRDAVLREVMEIFWKSSNLHSMAAWDGNNNRVRAGQYMVYQARNDRYDKYYFYYDDLQLGTAVSQNTENYPVQIQGGDLQLHAQIVNRYPLFYRLILRQTPAGPVAEGRLERVESNEYRLWIGSECIRVSTYGQMSRFYRGDQEIAILKKADDEDREYFTLRNKVSMEYYMTVMEALPRDLAILLLSFPCLKVML